MKASLSWLQRYVDLTGRTTEELCHAFTMVGFEVEGVERTGIDPMPHVVVGEVVTRQPHPQADRLSVCDVRIHPTGPTARIVCGAQNYKVGDRVPVALPGALLPGDFRIQVSKIRGVESNGMMCSARELGLGADHAGLLILDHRPDIGTPLHEALGPRDTVFHVEVTPNRPDCQCHLGLARELAAWFRLPLRYPELHQRGPLPGARSAAALLASATIEADEACPLYTAHAITGVRVGPSPSWLQEALRAIGLRPINNIVDITNFVLFETGQPLHAFDARRIHGGRIVVRTARDGESLVTLDGKERKLRTRDLVIADAERALVIAGIMGGAESGVEDTTTDIVLESAVFRPQGIRRTSRHLGLASDSSYRFERGIDACGTLPAAYRAIDLILEIAGGELLGPACVAGAVPSWQSEILLKPSFVRERAGFPIDDATICEALEALELEIPRIVQDAGGEDTWTVRIPTWRADLDRPIDLVEEVLRLYGTDRVPSGRVTLPSIVAEDAGLARFTRAAATFLVGQRFLEAVNYALRPADDFAGYVPAIHAAELRLANPLAEDQSHLRHSLLPGLLDTLRLNRSRQTGAERFFETGRVFRDRDGALHEYASVAFVIGVSGRDAVWNARPAPDLYAAKALVLELARLAGVVVPDAAWRPGDPANSSWQEGHCADAGGAAEGFSLRCGLLNLALLRGLGIEGTVLAGAFDVLPEKLERPAPVPRYTPISTHPPVLRDLAVVAPLATPGGDVVAAVETAARAAATGAFALETVRLFDDYRGAGLPEGHKSLAMRLQFRAADRTLTDDDVNSVFQDAIRRLESSTPWRVRR